MTVLVTINTPWKLPGIGKWSVWQVSPVNLSTTKPEVQNSNVLGGAKRGEKGMGNLLPGFGLEVVAACTATLVVFITFAGSISEVTVASFT